MHTDSKTVGLHSSDYRDRDPALMRSTMAEMFALFEQGKLDAAVETTFPLEKAGEALQYVKDGKVKGKVVLTTGLDGSGVVVGPPSPSPRRRTARRGVR